MELSELFFRQCHRTSDETRGLKCNILVNVKRFLIRSFLSLNFQNIPNETWSWKRDFKKVENDVDDDKQFHDLPDH